MFLVRTTLLLEELLALLWRVLQGRVENLLHLLPQIECHPSPLQRALRLYVRPYQPAAGLVRQDSTLWDIIGRDAVETRAGGERPQCCRYAPGRLISRRNHALDIVHFRFTVAGEMPIT